jgi:carboxyl-terminal processing protease
MNLCTSRPSRVVSRLLLLTSLAVTTLASPAVYAQATATAPVGDPVAEVSKKAWELAAAGKLSDVWQKIESLPEKSPAIASLRKDVGVAQEHAKAQQAKMVAAYQKKIDRMHAKATKGETIDALSSAVEALGLADTPDTLYRDESFKKLITAAEAEAQKHEENGDWLKALALYNRMELLFEKQDRYTSKLKRVGHQVGLIRLYAPEVLFELYKEEAKERGDEPEPWNVEDDHWQTQLENVDAAMLGESLALAARSWVEGSNFEDLLVGGIDYVKLLFTTPGLEKTFPQLADKAKTQPFISYLDEVRLSIIQRTVPMGYAEASNIVTRLLDKNDATVHLPQAVVVHELGDGAMSKLDDFSTIVWPHQKSRIDRMTQGTFSGVGIQISLVNRQLTVVTPLEDTPAHQAGIKPGDQIATIDGKSTLGIDLDAAVDKITGEEGTKVTLGIKSPEDKEPRNIELTRTNIKIVSVKGWAREGTGWNYYIDPALKVCYVRMTSFGPNTADEMDAAVEWCNKNGGVNGLILDLRFDPGGRLDAAVAVCNRFLKSGVIVSTSQKVVTGRVWRAMADGQKTYPDMPLVVLINKGSASASEITSGALQDHKRSLTVGERSFGKGSVQNLFRIGGEKGYLKLTTQYYRLPDGRIIHRRPGAKDWGIDPDVPVRMTDTQVAELLEARMLLDILRDPKDEKFDPQALLNKKKAKKDKDKDKDKEDQEPEEPKAPPVKSADEILTRGMDPQLETALLLIKTRLIGEPRG